MTQITEQLDKTQIAQEWIRYAKANFYHNEFSEDQNYSTITDEQWDVFGRLMGYLKENSDYPTPCGSEERTWYRAYAQIITGGRKYCKKVANKVIDGKGDYFSNDFIILEMIPFLKIILK
mgnify:CR=1 FL=1